MKEIRHDDAMAKMYHDDPDLTVAMLNELLEEGANAELLVVIKQLILASELGMKGVAEKAQVNSTQIYRTLSAEGKPSFEYLNSVLRAMNLQLAIHRKEERECA